MRPRRRRQTRCFSIRWRRFVSALTLCALSPWLQAEEAVDIDIPAGALSAGLIELGKQAELSIVFGEEAVAELKHRSVRGQLTPKAALAALLNGSCLQTEFVRPRLVALKPGCAPEPAAPPAAEAAPLLAEAAEPVRYVEEILVRERHLTGSRLTPAGVRTPAPLDVITRPEIELSGHQSLDQILRYLPAVAGNATSTLVTNGGDGTATVTLRGLPASNTLVLLNGRRMNPDALYGEAVDLNTLPLALIERIEVLKDGASAVYGSDAIAGVVNVLTRRDLQGWHADAYIGRSGQGDLDTRNVSVTYAFERESARFVGGASYYEQEGIFSRDRGLSESSDDRPRGGIDKRSSATSPARITLPTGPVILDTGSYRTATGEDRFEYRDYTALIVPSRRYSVFLEGEWQGDQLTWFAEVLGTRTRSDNTFAPTPLFTGFESVPLMVDANQAINPFGIDLYDVRQRLVEAGTRMQRNSTETRRGVLGVRGRQGVADWEFSVQQSRTEAREQLRGAIDAFAVAEALSASCIAPCVPLDAFGGAVSPDMLSFISAQPQSQGTSRLRAVALSVNAPLWSLPAGPIDIAFGSEYREETLNSQPDPLLAAGGVVGSGNFAPTEGQRSSWEAFAEVRLPLLKDRPAVHRLDAYLAGRVSQYSDFGRETNPKVLLHYQPTRAWSLRASYAHGFRAPNLIETFGGLSQSFEQLNDPCSLDANAASLPGCTQNSDPTLTQFLTVKGGNPKLLPERSRTFSLGAEWQHRYRAGELRVALDHYRIRQRNVVDTSAQLFINQAAEGIGFANRVVRDSNGNITRVLATYVNLGERDVSGMDLTLRATWDTARRGTFQLALNATHIAEFRDRVASTLPSVDQAGTFRDAASGGNGALPDWKASIGLNWQRGFWRAQYNGYLVSALNEIVPILGTRREMEMWATHNIQMSYLGPATRWFRVSLGMNNLLDEAPPFSAAAFNDSYDSRTYDITGRYGYLRLERSI